MICAFLSKCCDWATIVWQYSIFFGKIYSVDRIISSEFRTIIWSEWFICVFQHAKWTVRKHYLSNKFLITQVDWLVDITFWRGWCVSVRDDDNDKNNRRIWSEVIIAQWRMKDCARHHNNNQNKLSVSISYQQLLATFATA